MLVKKVVKKVVKRVVKKVRWRSARRMPGV